MRDGVRLKRLVGVLRRRLKVEDAQGHQHKPAGVGGGQFTGTGGGGSSASATSQGKPASPNDPGPNEALPDESRPELSKIEAKAAFWYCDDGYDKINLALRRGGELKPGLQKAHAALQSAFAKVRPFHKPVAAVRGLELEGDALRGFLRAAQHAAETGEALRVDGYMSTTTGGELHDTFSGANVVLQVAARRGLDMKPHSNAAGENELLLNHGSMFRVRGVSQEGDRYVVKMVQVR
jgi:hypothetical protein